LLALTWCAEYHLLADSLCHWWCGREHWTRFPTADADPDADEHPDADPDADEHPDADADQYADPDADTDHHADTDTDPDPDADTDQHADTDADTDSDADPNTNAESDQDAATGSSGAVTDVTGWLAANCRPGSLDRLDARAYGTGRALSS
jgi:hypothetical protein